MSCRQLSTVLGIVLAFASNIASLAAEDSPSIKTVDIRELPWPWGPFNAERMQRFDNEDVEQMRDRIHSMTHRFEAGDPTLEREFATMSHPDRHLLRQLRGGANPEQLRLLADWLCLWRQRHDGEFGRPGQIDRSAARLAERIAAQRELKPVLPEESSDFVRGARWRPEVFEVLLLGEILHARLSNRIAPWAERTAALAHQFDHRESLTKASELFGDELGGEVVPNLERVVTFTARSLADRLRQAGGQPGLPEFGTALEGWARENNIVTLFLRSRRLHAVAVDDDNGRLGPVLTGDAASALMKKLEASGQLLRPQHAAGATTPQVEPVLARCRAILAMTTADLPALQKQLSDPNEAIREAAVRKLRQLGSAAAAALPTLTKCLSDDHRVIAEQAAEAIWAIRPEFTPDLIGRLADSSPRAQIQMLRLLARHPSPSPELKVCARLLLKEDDREVRFEAARRLAAWGDRSPDTLQGLVSGLSGAYSAEAANELLLACGPMAIPVLTAELEKRPDDLVVREIVWLLDRYAQSVSLPAEPLLRLLDHPDPTTRKLVVPLAIRFGNPATPDLERWFESTIAEQNRRSTQRSATQEFAAFWGRQDEKAAQWVMNRLIPLLQQAEATEMESHCFDILSEMGARAVPAIRRAIESTSRRGRYQMVDLLRKVGQQSPESLQALEPLVSRGDVRQRIQAAVIYAQLAAAQGRTHEAPDEVVRVLIAGLTASDQPTRELAATGLGHLGQRAVPAWNELRAALEQVSQLPNRSLPIAFAGQGEKSAEFLPRLVDLAAHDAEGMRKLHQAGLAVVPLLAARLEEAQNEDDRYDLLEVIIGFGPQAREALPTLQRCFQRELNRGGQRIGKMILRAINAIEPDRADLAPLLLRAYHQDWIGSDDLDTGTRMMLAPTVLNEGHALGDCRRAFQMLYELPADHWPNAALPLMGQLLGLGDKENDAAWVMARGGPTAMRLALTRMWTARSPSERLGGLWVALMTGTPQRQRENQKVHRTKAELLENLQTDDFLQASNLLVDDTTTAADLLAALGPDISHPNPWTRLEVLRYLGQLGPRARPLLPALQAAARGDFDRSLILGGCNCALAALAAPRDLVAECRAAAAQAVQRIDGTSPPSIDRDDGKLLPPAELQDTKNQWHQTHDIATLAPRVLRLWRIARESQLEESRLDSDTRVYPDEVRPLLMETAPALAAHLARRFGHSAESDREALRILVELGRAGRGASSALWKLPPSTDAVQEAHLLLAIASIEGPSPQLAARALRALDSDNAALRMAAVVALAQQDSHVVNELQRRLNQHDVAKRRDVMRALLAIGPAARSATAAVTTILAEEDRELRNTAATFLILTADDSPASTQALSAMLSHGDVMIRERAPLGFYHRRNMPQEAVAVMQTWFPGERTVQAARRMAEVHASCRPVLLPKFLQWRRSSVESVANAAAAALDRLLPPVPESTAELTRLVVAASEPADADWLLERLAEIGLPARSARDAAGQWLSKGTPRVQAQAAVTMWKLTGDAKDAVPVIRNVMQEPDSTDRRLGCWAAATLEKDAQPLLDDLRRRLQDDCFEVREWAADALGCIGPAARPAIPDLLANLTHENRNVQFWCVNALGKLIHDHRDPKTVAALVALADRSRKKMSWANEKLDVPGTSNRQVEIKSVGQVCGEILIALTRAAKSDPAAQQAAAELLAFPSLTVYGLNQLSTTSDLPPNVVYSLSGPYRDHRDSEIRRAAGRVLDAQGPK